MTKPKKYQLKTIRDIVNIVNEDNLDNFTKDFRAFLNWGIVVRKGLKGVYTPELPENAREELQEAFYTTLNTFNWIDDGKNDFIISLKIKSENKNETKT